MRNIATMKYDERHRRYFICIFIWQGEKTLRWNKRYLIDFMVDANDSSYSFYNESIYALLHVLFDLNLLKQCLYWKIRHGLQCYSIIFLSPSTFSILHRKSIYYFLHKDNERMEYLSEKDWITLCPIDVLLLKYHHCLFQE
jgi:hypothetical protein